MAQQTIGIGAAANDGTGDTLRAAMDKCNDNFTELYAPPVTANAAAATPAATASGALYTNEGDTDGSSVTLPAAVAGLRFTFYVQVAQALTVTAAAGDTIRIAGSVTAAAGSISSAVVGSAVILHAINATEWVALSSVGAWTV